MTLETDPAFPRTAHATGPDLILAQQIVDSPEALGVYAACEWDELSDDGKEWIAVIVRAAQAQAAAAKEAEVYNRAIEDAAALAEDRHETWEMSHPDDAGHGEVCDDISACRDIAGAIRALAKELTSSSG